MTMNSAIHVPGYRAIIFVSCLCKEICFMLQRSCLYPKSLFWDIQGRNITAGWQSPGLMSQQNLRAQ